MATIQLICVVVVAIATLTKTAPQELPSTEQVICGTLGLSGAACAARVLSCITVSDAIAIDQIATTPIVPDCARQIGLPGDLMAVEDKAESLDTYLTSVNASSFQIGYVGNCVLTAVGNISNPAIIAPIMGIIQGALLSCQAHYDVEPASPEQVICGTLGLSGAACVAKVLTCLTVSDAIAIDQLSTTRIVTNCISKAGINLILMDVSDQTQSLDTLLTTIGATQYQIQAVGVCILTEMANISDPVILTPILGLIQGALLSCPVATH